MDRSQPHPIRLASMMLMGAFLGVWFFAPAVGNLLEPWMQWGPLVSSTSGAIGGLAVELVRRSDAAIQRVAILALTVLLGAGLLLALLRMWPRIV
jgi:hypothetical protein